MPLELYGGKFLIVYLPLISQNQVDAANATIKDFRRSYPMDPADYEDAVRCHRRVFMRLLQIDPVLQRMPNSNCELRYQEPFLVKYELESKSEVKKQLVQAHSILGRYNVPIEEKKRFLKTLTLLNFYIRLEAQYYGESLNVKLLN